LHADSIPHRAVARAPPAQFSDSEMRISGLHNRRAGLAIASTLVLDRPQPNLTHDRKFSSDHTLLQRAVPSDGAAVGWTDPLPL